MIGHLILPSFFYSIVFKLKRLPFLRTAFFGYWVFFSSNSLFTSSKTPILPSFTVFFFHQSEAVPFPSGSDWERWLVSQFYRVLPSFSYLVERRTPFWFHRHALFTEFYWVFFQMKNGSLAKNVSLLPSFTEFFYIINFIINFFRLWLRPLILNLILPSFTEFFLLQQQQSAWLLQRLIVYRVLPSFFLKSGPFLISTVSTVEMVDWPTNFTEFYRVFLI